jgi:flagellar hook-associated protein 2
VVPYTATSSNSNAVSATTTGSAQSGRYEVVVSSLAKAQVTVSTSTTADTNTTTVATGGSITIGGKVVNIGSAVTLQGLADAINSTTGIGVNAGVIQTGTNVYQLMLTSSSTGAAGAFTIVNGLTGGGANSVVFADHNSNGISGDQDSDNAVKAADASATINNIPVTSSTNTLGAAIPGVSFTLNQADPLTTVVVTVGQDSSTFASNINSFVSAYNDLISFYNDQRTAAKNGNGGNLANDPMLRGVINALKGAINSSYGSGTFTNLSVVGIGFNQTGQLTLDNTALNAATATSWSQVASLFTGSSANGAFATIGKLLDDYGGPAGFVSTADQQLARSLSRLQDQIDQMSARLAQRKLDLQAQFTAADQAMAALNAQTNSLSHLGINS